MVRTVKRGEWHMQNQEKHAVCRLIGATGDTSGYHHQLRAPECLSVQITLNWHHFCLFIVCLSLTRARYKICVSVHEVTTTLAI